MGSFTLVYIWTFHSGRATDGEGNVGASALHNRLAALWVGRLRCVEEVKKEEAPRVFAESWLLHRSKMNETEGEETNGKDPSLLGVSSLLSARMWACACVRVFRGPLDWTTSSSHGTSGLRLRGPGFLFLMQTTGVRRPPWEFPRAANTAYLTSTLGLKMDLVFWEVLCRYSWNLIPLHPLLPPQPPTLPPRLVIVGEISARRAHPLIVGLIIGAQTHSLVNLSTFFFSLFPNPQFTPAFEVIRRQCLPFVFGTFLNQSPICRSSLTPRLATHGVNTGCFAILFFFVSNNGNVTLWRAKCKANQKKAFDFTHCWTQKCACVKKINKLKRNPASRKIMDEASAAAQPEATCTVYRVT